jgi:phage gpG-like protein
MPKSGGLKITDKDKGWSELANKVLKLSTQGAYVQVGVLGAEAAANHNKAPGLTVAQIASVHEFGRVIHTKRGVINIPERSFLRATIDIFHDAIQKRATMLATGAMLGKFSVGQSLALLGTYAVGVIKQRIADGIAPPNSPLTIARKRSSKPLIDSGQLRGSITYRVEAS